MHRASSLRVARWSFVVSIALPLLSVACKAPAAAAGPQPTNGTVTFQVRDQALGRATMVHLLAAKQDRAPMQGGAPTAGGIAGSREFPAGTRANGIARYYATLLTQHGWTEGSDFVAAENSLHFYGICQLGGSSSDPQLQIHGATDSAAIPFQTPSP